MRVPDRQPIVPVPRRAEQEDRVAGRGEVISLIVVIVLIAVIAVISEISGCRSYSVRPSRVPGNRQSVSVSATLRL